MTRKGALDSDLEREFRWIHTTVISDFHEGSMVSLQPFCTASMQYSSIKPSYIFAKVHHDNCAGNSWQKL
jgi:hypothetical protein